MRAIIRHRVFRCVVSLFMATLFLPIMQSSAYGNGVQEGGESESVDNVEILGQLNAYYVELQDLSSISAVTEQKDSLLRLSKSLKMIDLKWNGYYKEREQIISSDDAMLVIVVECQTLIEQVGETLRYRQGLCDAMSEVELLRANIEASVNDYDKWVEESVALSLTKSLAKALEKLKADEQLRFESVSGSYDKAKQLADQYEEISPIVDSMNVQYLKLKRESEVIQSQEYKPLFVRIKDYLLGLAAVTMILMFFNMVMTKIKAVRAESKRLKKLKNMMNIDDNNYPTI